MIRRIEVRRFRSLRGIEVDLEPYQMLVGPNASGKSTFFDVINLVRDSLHFGLDTAVYGNLRFGVPQRAADPVELSWMGRGTDIEIAITVELPEPVRATTGGRYGFVRYEVAIGVQPELEVRGEALWLCESLPRRSERTQGLFPDSDAFFGPLLVPAKAKCPAGRKKVIRRNGDKAYYTAETSKWISQARVSPLKTALGRLEEEDLFPAGSWCRHFLMEGVQRLALNAEAMRMPCRPGSPKSFMPDGSNLPWVVHELETHQPKLMAQWMDHLRTALPDLRSVSTVEREEDRSRYLVLEYATGLRAPSWLVSDGTLRLLALTLLAYSPLTPTLTLIEEPENGVHPQAIETIVQSLGSVYGRQLFCATHSPIALSLAKPAQVLCFSKDAQGASDVIRGDQHPHLRDWQGSVNLGELFATGVLS